MIDLGTATTIALAGAGAAGSIGAWAIRAYTQVEVGKVDTKLEVHVAQDAIVHTHIKESLDRIEKKLDRL